jgi:uncharacterized protein (DUF1697 family)
LTIYLALLRGINVSGHHMIKMAELKRMFEEMGFGGVQTYINSGNVLFESEDGEEPLQARIEQEIQRVFGFAISVILRTAEEWERIVATCPFSMETLTEGQSIHLTLLRSAPTQDELDRLPHVDQQNDQCLIDGREIYFLYRQSILDSKLTKKFSKLVPQTARNWKTVMKLAAMAKAMETN